MFEVQTFFQELPVSTHLRPYASKAAGYAFAGSKTSLRLIRLAEGPAGVVCCWKSAAGEGFKTPAPYAVHCLQSRRADACDFHHREQQPAPITRFSVDNRIPRQNQNRLLSMHATIIPMNAKWVPQMSGHCCNEWMVVVPIIRFVFRTFPPNLKCLLVAKHVFK